MTTPQTDLAILPDSTDNSAISDLSLVTNNDFLIAIYGDEDRDDLPFVCGFKGHPKAAAGGWKAKPWIVGQTDTKFEGMNAYYSVGTFHPNAQSQWRRIDSLCAGLAALVFDDVGVKVTDMDRLAGVPPSYVIETSPGNFQYGYILAEQIKDQGIANALIQAAIDAGLSDPGAKGINRLARLPNGVNGKYDPAFPCRLVSWNPERRYTP